MCYPPFVMLWGRCSCAISGRPSPSPAPKYPLSPIIPVHPRNSPVSPIIPVHTQKQGGGALKKLSATSGQRSASKKKADPYPSFCCSPLVYPACPELRGERFLRRVTRLPRAILAKGHSPLIPIISAPLATAALRVVPAPIFTTTSRGHVGVPTFVTLRTPKGQPRNRSEDRPLHRQTQEKRNPRAQAGMPVPPNPGRSREPGIVSSGGER